MSEKHKQLYLDYYRKSRKYAKMIKACKTPEDLKKLIRKGAFERWLSKN